MIRNDVLQCFILGFGLELTDDDLGRATNLTPLWLSAKEKCGECSMDELLDALYTLPRGLVNLYKFVPPAEWHGQLIMDFEHWRDEPTWKEFFNGDFRIKILPPGRVRFEKLSAQLRVEISQHEPPPTRRIGFTA